MSFILIFCLSIVILFLTIWYAVKHPKKRLTVLTIGIYLMILFLVFPFGNLNEPWGFVRNIFLSVVKTAQIFGLNSEFNAEVELLNTSQWFAWIYSTWLSILYLVAPILTASFLLTLSRTTRNWLKWKLNRKKEVWVFSEPSEKALLFAESALKDPKEDICVLFCDAVGEYYERIVEIGAIATLRRIDELGENYFIRCSPTLFFMGEDEQRNLEQTLNFAQKHKNTIEKEILLYCFNSKTEAGLMLNTLDLQTKSKIRFRRIAENKAVVYQELMQISDSLGDKKPGETLHFMIVGCGWIGLELIKALLWCFVRYNVVIDVIDKANIEKRFYRSCPGLLEKNGDGFKINYLPNEDIHTLDISKISDVGSIDYVFVALGNDIINMECAVYLRQTFRRLHRQNPCKHFNQFLLMPEIHVVINSPENKNLELIDHEISYDIKSFIKGQNYYTTHTLLNYGIEKQALINYLSWLLFYANIDIENGEPDKKKEAQNSQKTILGFVHNDLKDGELTIENHAQWRRLILDNPIVSKFYNDDYNSWSSRARAIFDWCDSKNSHSSEIEHRRWIMYMLTEGYQYGTITDHIAKLHSDIREDFNDYRDLKYQEILSKLMGK